MDTPSLPLIMTTLPDEKSIQTGKFIEIGDVNPLAWVVIIAVVVSIVFSSICSFFIVSRLDGQRWVGWTAQNIELKGKSRKVLVPLFMTPGDLKDLREEK